MATCSYPTGVLLCHSRYFVIALADEMIYQDQRIIKSDEPRVPRRLPVNLALALDSKLVWLAVYQALGYHFPTW